MKRMLNWTNLFFLVFIIGCSTNSNVEIYGKWDMYQVIQSGQDVTAEHNPHNERFLVLNEDGTFETGGRPYGKNTGQYSFDKNEMKLILDSDVGPEDDSQWVVSMKGDTMHWRGFGTEWAEGFEIINLRNRK